MQKGTHPVNDDVRVELRLAGQRERRAAAARKKARTAMREAIENALESHTIVQLADAIDGLTAKGIESRIYGHTSAKYRQRRQRELIERENRQPDPLMGVTIADAARILNTTEGRVQCRRQNGDLPWLVNPEGRVSVLIDQSGEEIAVPEGFVRWVDPRYPNEKRYVPQDQPWYGREGRQYARRYLRPKPDPRALWRVRLGLGREKRFEADLVHARKHVDELALEAVQTGMEAAMVAQLMCLPPNTIRKRINTLDPTVESRRNPPGVGVTEAAGRLGVTRLTVTAWARAGRVPVARFPYPQRLWVLVDESGEPVPAPAGWVRATDEKWPKMVLWVPPDSGRN